MNHNKALKKSSSKKSIYAKHYNGYENFVELKMNLFDIKATDKRTLYQQKLWGVKMTDLDKKFYEKQKLVPHVGYCSTFVDRK